MKVRRQGAALALMAAGVSAQAGYGSSSSSSTTSMPTMSVSTMTATPSTSYLTVTYDDCPSMSMESMITVTNGVTVTYCPECEMMSTSAAPTPGHTTVYTTVYQSLCPTGLVPVTHTITESCTEPTPTWTPGPSHIPQGYTVTTKACTVCGPSTSEVVITEQCGCNAHEGTVMPTTTPAGSTPAAAPPAQTTPASGGQVSQISDGQIQAPPASAAPSGTPVSQISDGQIQAPPATGGSAPAGSAPAGSAPAGSNPAPPAGTQRIGTTAPAAPGSPGSPAAPSATTATQSCPGPQCQMGGTPSGITPSPGAATNLSGMGALSSIIMVVTAALAFML